jgi:glycosyltransferase involved in cell wall biosynthesis
MTAAGNGTNGEPLVSVILPCYNAAEYLVQSLESILHQTYRNLEVIVIDDGSTDETAAILRRYEAKDRRIRLVRNDINRKLIHTLNRGIGLARGKYIARMDADDISFPERIEKLVRELENNPGVDFVSSGFYIIDARGKIIYTSVPKALTGKPLKFVSFFSTPLLHPGLLIRSEVLKEAGFSAEYLHCEDYELFSRLALEGHEARNLGEPLIYYRANPASVSNQYEQIQISAHTRISLRNIETYFNVTPEYFTHKIMIHRIAFTVRLRALREAVRLLHELRDRFIAREQCTPAEIAEIDLFLIEQQIDIIFQAIKHARHLWKLPLLGYLAAHARLVVSPRGYRYLRAKLGSKAIAYKVF